MAREIVEDGGSRMVSTVLTIRRTPTELYHEWRDFVRLPDIMEQVISVVELDERRSHWEVSAPGGSVEWDAETVEDIPGELISWHTVGATDVEHSGEVRFVSARQGPGTEMSVVLRWRPPAGAVGAAIAKLTGDDPAKQLDVDLQRFKQRMETGHVATTRGQPRGSAQSDDLKDERDEMREETELAVAATASATRGEPQGAR